MNPPKAAATMRSTGMFALNQPLMASGSLGDGGGVAELDAEGSMPSLDTGCCWSSNAKPPVAPSGRWPGVPPTSAGCCNDDDPKPRGKRGECQEIATPLSGTV